MESENSIEKSSSPVPKFDWIEYRKKHEICYAKDFLREHQNEPKSFYEALDLPVTHQEVLTQKFGGIDEVADRLYKKILRHGQLEPMSSIAKKTGAIGKLKKAADGQMHIDRDVNYYDQNDPFIDDEELQLDKHRNQMDFVIAEYSDFASFEGSLAQFVKSDIYKNRLEILDYVGKDVGPEQPKRKLLQASNQQEAQNKKLKDKDTPVDKVKKKVKKNPITKQKKQPSTENQESKKDLREPVQTVVSNTIPAIPTIVQNQRFAPPDLVPRLTTEQAQAVFQQLSQFQLHNPINFPMGMGGPNRMNPMMFYPIGSPMGMPPLGYPVNSQSIQKKESEIIEIDHE